VARKSERLMNLVIALLVARRPLTVSQVRDSVEGYSGASQDAFLKAFDRDRDELAALGIRIERVPTSPLSDVADGYRLRPADFELPPLELTAEEATLAGLAGHVWQEATLQAATGRAMAKLKAAGVGMDTGRVTAIAPVLAANEPAFDVIWQAWLVRRAVKIVYHGKARVIEPGRLASRRGRWYAIARDRSDPEAGAKVFRLSRVENQPQLVAGEPPFEPLAPEAVAGPLARLNEPEEQGRALVAIRPGMAPALRRRGHRADGPAPDGYSLFEVPYAYPDQVVGDAAAAGADVLVLEPAGLRAAVLERLRFSAGRAA
jgi:proteasome accessory factor B